MVSEMREGNFNRVERAERVEKGLGVSSQELGLAAKNAESAKVWPMVRLGDVCVFRRGLTYAKADEVAYSSKVVLRSNNVDLETGILNLNDLKYLREDFEIPSEKIRKPNTLLMCMANGSKSHLGKVALIEQDFEYAFGGFMGLLLPKDITPKYLYYFLKAPVFKAYVKSLQDGANINNLKFSDFSELQIPLPPIEVQKEIVERLEKELGEADKVAAEFKRTVELADKEFKAELDEMFGGLREKGSGVGSQELGLAAKNAKGAKDWPMVRMGDVCEFRRGLTYAKADEVAYSSKVVLRSNNVDLESGELNLNDLKYLREDFEVPVEKIIEPNTLLMCMANGSKSHLGKVALIEQDFKYAFGGFMGLLLPRNMNSKYLYYFLSAPLFKAYVKSLQDGANINNLKFSDFSEFQIPLPSIEVQKEIVAKLDAAKERCEKLKAAAERGLTAAENLRKAILSEAFEL